MATINRSGNQFAAIVLDWTIDMKDYTKKVWQESFIQFVYFMQRPTEQGGNMPVKTGFLRSSLMVSTSPLAWSRTRKPDTGFFQYTWFPTEMETTVRSAKVGQTLYCMYQAEYASVIEYEYYMFQRLAVQMWPTIVEQVKARLSA